MESTNADLPESHHYRKEKMTVTWRDKVQNGNTEKQTCSLGTASALFDMSNADFVKQFVVTNRIQANRLHQFDMKDVMRLYRLYKNPPRWNQGYNR